MVEEWSVFYMSSEHIEPWTWQYVYHVPDEAESNKCNF